MSKEETIAKLLKNSTPIQLALVRAALEEKSSYYCQGITWQEYQLTLKALEAFDKGKYDDPHISRYLSPKIIQRIYG